MVGIFKPFLFNVGPPRRIILVARHDNVFHVETLYSPQLLLYLTNTARHDWRGSKAIFERHIITIRLEIMVAGVNNNILYNITRQLEMRCGTLKGKTYQRSWCTVSNA
jgi:hypothetical protein